MLITVALFWPTLVWMGRETVAHEQMRHAFMVLLLGCVALVQTEGRRLPVILRMGRLATGYLTGSFVVLTGALVSGSSFLVLFAGALAVVAWIVFWVGPSAQRVALGIFGVFMGYTLLIILLPFLDWPLRLNAGQQTVWVLNLMGIHSSLLLMDPANPRLILLVGRHPFEVAAECNGFGLLAGTVLLALLLATFRRSVWMDKLLLVAVAVVLGIAGNTLRILGIVFVAPYFPAGAYHAIHEVIGITFFWATLFAVWWVATSLTGSVETSQKETVGRAEVEKYAGSREDG
ncbi:MAG: hypothetical protein OHK005_09330 [Candidatus Methylacidiphilales bacterium]